MPDVGTHTFQIEDTALKNSIRLKMGIKFEARVTAVRSKPGGNRYLAFCNGKLYIKFYSSNALYQPY